MDVERERYRKKSWNCILTSSTHVSWDTGHADNDISVRAECVFEQQESIDWYVSATFLEIKGE
jgi:hypothetical protein